MGFFTDAIKWISGDSVAATLVKTAGLGYISKLLTDTAGSDKSELPPAVDPGVRLQLNPSTENKIPVLYGEAYFSGDITDLDITSNYKTARYAVTLAELTGTKLSDATASSYTFHDVYLNNNRVVFKADGVTVDYTVDSGGNQDVNYRDLIKIYFYAGTPLQPDGFGGTTPAADTIMPNWTAVTHPMTGLMYAIVEVNYNQQQGVTGLPECVFHVENDMHLPGDVLYDYMTSDVYGPGIDPNDIDNTLADLNTYGAAGFTYTDALGTPGQSGVIDINGLVDTGTQCLRNMEELAEAVNAWVSYNIYEGQWGITINQTGSSVASFSNDNVIGDIKVSGTSLTQLHNAVDVKYQNTDIKDKTDFVKIEIAAGDLFANEPRTTLQLDLPFCNKQSVAIKVGLIALKQARVDKVITFRSDFSFINVEAGQIIDVTEPELNMTNKLFRVITTKEVEGDAGEIQVEFTALEYQAAVYDYNIEEFEVETDDGLFSAGAIGKPDAPVVTKFEQSNQPRVVMEADVPSGIVDTMEFYLTYDVTEPTEANRSYFKIGQQTSANTYTENETVNFTYNGLTQADFFVKVRGTNSLAVGPFSDPTGLIEYRPVVVADTLSDDPVDFGGSLMSLGLLTLLNNLDSLLSIFNGTKSIEDAIKEIFFPGSGDSTETAAEALLNDANFTSNLPVGPTGPAGPPGADGVGTTVNSLNDVIAGNPGLDYQLYWDGTSWVARPCDYCGTQIDPGECTGIAGTTPSNNASNVPFTGSYAFTMDGAVREIGGSAHLYKSDGTLVESVASSSMTFNGDTVVIPFAARTPGTDYYILLDKGIAQNCDGCINEALCLPNAWYFTTAAGAVDSYSFVSGVTCDKDSFYSTPSGNEVSITGTTTIVEGNDCLSFNGCASVEVDIEGGSSFGSADSFTIEDCSDNVLMTVNVCKSNAGNQKGPFNVAWVWTGTKFIVTVCQLELDSCYVVRLPSDLIKGAAGAVGQIVTPSQAGPQPDGQQASVIDTANSNVDLNYTNNVTATGATGSANVYKNDGTLMGSYQASDPEVSINNSTTFTVTGFSPADDATEVPANSTITLTFNTRFTVGLGAFYLYKAPGTLVQTFDVDTSFGDDNTHQIIEFSDTTVTLNPTVYMEREETYYIQADSGCIISACGVDWAGINDTTTYNFTIESGPEVTSQTPLNGATSQINDNAIQLDFDSENLQPGTGNLNIFKDDGTLIASIPADDPRVSIT